MDLLGDRGRHELDATVTTEHGASSYGIPVVVLPDGEALSIASWMLLDYQIVEATREELQMLVRALSPYTIPYQAASMGRKGGASTSDAKRAAARANGRRGGRPKKQADG